MVKKLVLKITDKTDERLQQSMLRHYTQPKGFVGRSICYAILYEDTYYGHIVGGSAPKWLPGRDEFFGIRKSQIQHIVDNIFFHVEKVDGKYPLRNFVPSIISEWRELIYHHWQGKYGTSVFGFESLVELPRTGECYKRDDWFLVGQTKGYTCKREDGYGTDSWSGRRVWDTKNLRPKLVFCKKI